MKKLIILIGVMTSVVLANGSLCSKDDKVVFSCDMKKKKLSVCKEKNALVYKYGTLGNIELSIQTKPKYSSRQFVRANYENHLRFHNKGYDYVIYSNEMFTYAKRPNDGTGRYVARDGVYVVKANKVLTKLTCKKTFQSIGNMQAFRSLIENESYEGY